MADLSKYTSDTRSCLEICGAAVQDGKMIFLIEDQIYEVQLPPGIMSTCAFKLAKQALEAGFEMPEVVVNFIRGGFKADALDEAITAVEDELEPELEPEPEEDQAAFEEALALFADIAGNRLGAKLAYRCKSLIGGNLWLFFSSDKPLVEADITPEINTWITKAARDTVDHFMPGYLDGMGLAQYNDELNLDFGLFFNISLRAMLADLAYRFAPLLDEKSE